MSNFDDEDFAIKVDNISKKFLLGRRSSSIKDRLTGMSERNREEFWAFQNISVTVPKGTMLGVIGRNGSGKSTFLRALCGVYRPTTGSVHVRGRVTALLELGAGFHTELTGRENVYMNGSIVGLDRDYMDDVMDEIIEMADIGSFIDAPIETYSSGMRARLGFAVSVQLQPEILLADEITAVGDIAFKRHGVKRMDKLREGGATIVQVSHSLPLLEANCDRILWLHHGQLRRLGDPAEVIEEYRSFAAIDQSGRMIGGEHSKLAPAPAVAKSVNVKDINEQQAKVTNRLSADDVNSDWFKEVSFQGTVGGLTATKPALLSVEMSAPREITNPMIRAQVLNHGGTETGLAYQSETLASQDLNGPIEASIDRVTLPGGRYILRVEVLEDGKLVATQHLPLLVRHPSNAGKPVSLDARWGVAAPQL